MGILLAAIYAGFLYLFRTTNWPEIFLTSTNFLFWWYVVTSALIGLVVGLATLMFAVGGAVTGGLVGSESGGGKAGAVAGALLGLLGGGALSLLMLVSVAVGRLSLIYGTYLLHNSLLLTVSGGAEWDQTKLMIGGFLLLLGLVMGKGSGSSSSNKNSD
ncbi:MAG: hypothetical protein HZB99_00605 [Candidatus Harrisonbacteria bacterium]|nr:hypothetical protein [Candidatus Harrisonbacteria bacterium]